MSTAVWRYVLRRNTSNSRGQHPPERPYRTVHSYITCNSNPETAQKPTPGMSRLQCIHKPDWTTATCRHNTRKKPQLQGSFYRVFLNGPNRQL